MHIRTLQNDFLMCKKHITPYRGRIAPTPTRHLHLGHAQTFWIAAKRAKDFKGKLIYRCEDLDIQRCKQEYHESAIHDLQWLGIKWDEGPDIRGPHNPYIQSQRTDRYRKVFEELQSRGFIYPCKCSRKDVAEAASAPHKIGIEPVYPGTCRPKNNQDPYIKTKQEDKINWRFRIPSMEKIKFFDGNFGEQQFVTNKDFGDFIIWRHDDIPSYQLAVVVDDHDMGVTEVVRGADLLKCTARQILLYYAMEWIVPEFFHCPLVNDLNGERLAKRSNALSLRSMRNSGQTAQFIIDNFDF